MVAVSHLGLSTTTKGEDESIGVAEGRWRWMGGGAKMNTYRSGCGSTMRYSIRKTSIKYLNNRILLFKKIIGW
ncbi:unnamed protein product [Chondrus crispus]|uniref:Uncharacterized protein n=1 Tax=Chondrus crispus TaxID=2769 RepID=R7QFC4_CHOCR|nr:unnamed protein product [Chondrus crispus]CDF36789.1 unnamed protein product [Chondrus crispus]|eukprot:XP_005716608.1 unnamed protein product [Chondrus crispus]